MIILHPAKPDHTDTDVAAPAGKAGAASLPAMALEEQHALYQYMPDAAPDGVIGADRDGLKLPSG